MFRMLSVLVALAFALPAAAQQPVLKFGIIDFPQAYIKGADGTWSGETYEIATRAALAAGVRLEFVEAPPVRFDELFNRGDIDLSIITTRIFKPETVHIDDRHVYIGDLRSYALGRDPEVVKFEDLRGKSVVVMRGYSYGVGRAFIDDPQNRVTIAVQANTHQQSLDALLAGRAEILLQYDNNVGPLIARHPRGAEFRSREITKIPFQLVVARRLPNGEAVFKQMQAAIAEIKGGS